MKEILNKIQQEMRYCGQIMLNADRTPQMVSDKSGHANFVTTYDKLVQQEMQQRLGAILPEAEFIGEEDDEKKALEAGYAFIVDPIDGTTNFIKDYKCSCISVGLLKDGKQVLGAVYNPYLDEMFTAIAGQGAYLNGQPIHVTDNPIEEAIVIFGTSPYYKELNEPAFRAAYNYFQKSLDIRRSGSAAIDLCNVAAGRAELFFELRLSPWDYAAGSLIVKEAGGVVTSFEGAPLQFEEPMSVKATNGVCK